MSERKSKREERENGGRERKAEVIYIERVRRKRIRGTRTDTQAGKTGSEL